MTRIRKYNIFKKLFQALQLALLQQSQANFNKENQQKTAQDPITSQVSAFRELEKCFLGVSDVLFVPQFFNSDAGDDERARLGIPIRQLYATAAATSRQSARRTTGNAFFFQICILSTCRTQLVLNFVLIETRRLRLDKRAEFGKINKLPSRVIESTLRK